MASYMFREIVEKSRAKKNVSPRKIAFSENLPPISWEITKFMSEIIQIMSDIIKIISEQMKFISQLMILIFGRCFVITQLRYNADE